MKKEPLSKDRWIEIKFTTLCYDVYDKFKDYVSATNYLQFLADLAKMDRAVAMRLLQKVTLSKTIRPSGTEFICVARQNGCTIKEILTKKHMSKSSYIEVTHYINFEQERRAQSPPEDLENMKKLLEAHDTVRRLGICSTT